MWRQCIGEEGDVAKRKPTTLDFCGYRIQFCPFQKRWFVQDWDYETGYFDIGPSHPTKWAAMDWCQHRGI